MIAYQYLEVLNRRQLNSLFYLYSVFATHPRGFWILMPIKPCQNGCNFVIAESWSDSLSEILVEFFISFGIAVLGELKEVNIFTTLNMFFEL